MKEGERTWAESKRKFINVATLSSKINFVKKIMNRFYNSEINILFLPEYSGDFLKISVSGDHRPAMNSAGHTRGLTNLKSFRVRRRRI